MQKAFERLGCDAQFVSEPRGLDRAGAVVFPGQGASPSAMAALLEHGMAEPVRRWIGDGKPFFGVCLGLQLLFDRSEEGDTPGLGVVPGVVRRFPAGLKAPHMGWNTVELVRPHPLFEGAHPENCFYFVHSYYADPDDPSWTTGLTDYGAAFASVVARGNVVATQFHPEKSGDAGLLLYRNFIDRIVRRV